MQLAHQRHLSPGSQLEQLSGEYGEHWKLFKGNGNEDYLESEQVIPSFLISLVQEKDTFFPRTLLMNPNSHIRALNTTPQPSFRTSSIKSEETIAPGTEHRRDTHSNSNFSKEEDLYEPISIDHNRTPQQRAALNSMLEQTVDFLFGNSGVAPKPPPVPKKSNLSPLDAIGKQGGTLAFLTMDIGESRKKRKRDDEDSIPAESSRSGSTAFRSYQTENWDARYEELVEYREEHFHCCVPYDYPPNPSLARWVKRQRYQYKLFMENKTSAMTSQRQEALESLGFIWDAHTAAWERRLIELKAYRLEHGHCDVPSTYRANRKLASWVKCQRRHYKLHRKGLPSTMTEYRVEALNDLGFAWEVRASASGKKDEYL